jgi:hypothetical protein
MSTRVAENGELYGPFGPSLDVPEDLFTGVSKVRFAERSRASPFRKNDDQKRRSHSLGNEKSFEIDQRRPMADKQYAPHRSRSRVLGGMHASSFVHGARLRSFLALLLKRSSRRSHRRLTESLSHLNKRKRSPLQLRPKAKRLM